MKNYFLKLTNKLYFCLFLFCLLNTLKSQDNEQNYRGNWYEKLHWWKKAKPKYDAISVLIDQIKIVKKDLSEKHKTLVDKYNKFIANLKIDPKIFIKKIDENLKNIENQFEEELINEDNQIISNLNETKKTLEQLKNDFQTLVLLKNKIDESIVTILENQVNLADSYEEKALNSFEEIEKVLDDKKARELYESIENANENIQNIKTYIITSLKNFFLESSIKLDELISTISFVVPNLEKEDIFLREISPEELERIKKDIKEVEKQITSIPEKLPENNKNFIQKILDFLKNIFNYILKHIFNI